MILIFLCGWIIYRHLWLNLILKLNPALTDPEHQAARRAASPLALIFASFVFWMLIFLAMLLLFYRVINFPVWGFQLIMLFMLAYPSAMFLRSLKADAGKYVFPSRRLAALLIAGAALLHLAVFALTIALAKGLVHVMTPA